MMQITTPLHHHGQIPGLQNSFQWLPLSSSVPLLRQNFMLYMLCVNMILMLPDWHVNTGYKSLVPLTRFHSVVVITFPDESLWLLKGEYSATLVLELHSFPKAICSKTKPFRWLIIPVSLWNGCQGEPQFCSTTRTFFPWITWSRTKLFKMGDVQELRFVCTTQQSVVSSIFNAEISQHFEILECGTRRNEGWDEWSISQ